jgi:hypothetical protein
MLQAPSDIKKICNLISPFTIDFSYISLYTGFFVLFCATLRILRSNELFNC